MISSTTWHSAISSHLSERLLHCSAAEDIPQSGAIRGLLSDIKQYRGGKIRQGFKAIDGNYLQTDNFGLMEIESIRPFFSKAFNQIRDLQPL